jgi:hypothetical protein
MSTALLIGEWYEKVLPQIGSTHLVKLAILYSSNINIDYKIWDVLRVIKGKLKLI